MPGDDGCVPRRVTDATSRIARELHRRGLGGAARLLADAHRPLGPLIADLGVAVGGIAGRLPGFPASARELMADERALDRLVRCLDALEERDAESR